MSRRLPTPTGSFSILTKEVDPTWDVPVSIRREMKREGKTPLVRVAPGPDNPLGDRWLGLSLPGVGIHGTNAPARIYTIRRTAASACIRPTYEQSSVACQRQGPRRGRNMARYKVAGE